MARDEALLGVQELFHAAGILSCREFFKRYSFSLMGTGIEKVLDYWEQNFNP